MTGIQKVIISLMLSILVLGSPGLLLSEEIENKEYESPDWGIVFDIYSRYAWKGLAFSEGPVFQPSIWGSVQPVTLSLWSNVPLSDEANQGQVNELDLTMTVEHSCKDIDITANLFYYSYYHQAEAPATGEVEIILGRSLKQSYIEISNSIDFIEYPEAYSGGISIGFPYSQIYNKLGVSWASERFAQAYVDTDARSFLWVNYSLTALSEFDLITIESNISLSYQLDKNIRQLVADPFLGTIGFSFYKS